MEEDYTSNTFLLQVDNGNIPYLTEAAKWAKFLSIIGFIICAMLVLTGVFWGTFLAASFAEVDSEFKSLEGIGTGLFTIWFVIIALLYFFPSLYLFNFASKMQTALRNSDQISLNTSFKNLKSCLKFWGIFLIIILCFYALVIIFAILGTAFLR
jgi:hypothetical protein